MSLLEVPLGLQGQPTKLEHRACVRASSSSCYIGLTFFQNFVGPVMSGGFPCWAATYEKIT